ncbi:lysoplasmalogenase [Streptomyces flavofungini]|uniref:lysoplasmalogenase n=1 Tax=Streptomyces flavofungini TaxID=68200 RepID=UPI003F5408FB
MEPGEPTLAPSVGGGWAQLPLPGTDTPTSRRHSYGTVALAAFALAAAGDLAALALGSDTGHTVLKPLLMPLLAAYAVLRAGPPLLAAALLFGWGGDVLLLGDADPLFLAGMGSFAVGHLCYLALFRRHGEQHAPARGTFVVATYACALIVTVALLWTDLPSDMRIPVAGYSLLLTAMAFGATTLGLTAAAGGGLFLLSDTLIATDVADWPQAPRPDFWIMLTYLAAQALLTRGVLTGALTNGSAPERR